LIEIFTRDDPYPGMPALSVATQLAAKELTPQIPRNLSSLYAGILSECLSYSAEDRPSFKTLCDTLEEMAP